MIDVITGVSTAIDIAKKLKEVSDKIQNAEVSNLIADLMVELAEVKSLSADLRIENADLKEEVRDLKKGAQREDLFFKDGAYYSESGDGPFCSSCHDVRDLYVRMLEGNYGSGPFYYCPNKECDIQIRKK